MTPHQKSPVPPMALVNECPLGSLEEQDPGSPFSCNKYTLKWTFFCAYWPISNTLTNRKWFCHIIFTFCIPPHIQTSRIHLHYVLGPAPKVINNVLNCKFPKNVPISINPYSALGSTTQPSLSRFIPTHSPGFYQITLSGPSTFPLRV
jgi:hypothetical protein